MYFEVTLSQTVQVLILKYLHLWFWIFRGSHIPAIHFVNALFQTVFCFYPRRLSLEHFIFFFVLSWVFSSAQEEAKLSSTFVSLPSEGTWRQLRLWCHHRWMVFLPSVWEPPGSGRKSMWLASWCGLLAVLGERQQGVFWWRVWYTPFLFVRPRGRICPCFWNCMMSCSSWNSI